MANYLHWDRKNISDFSESNICSLYDEGYVFTRRGKGVMDQTRSLRIDLSRFEMSSENRRILRKTEGLELKMECLPYSNYHWSIGKLAKDFYDEKFGGGTFSANKVRELLSSGDSSFNVLFSYVILSERNEERVTEVEGSHEKQGDPSTPLRSAQDDSGVAGYAICYENNELLHYSYPFYALDLTPYASMGMGMMLRAISYAKDTNKKYVYLGSAQRSTDTYKFQFKGLEWFDGKEWVDDFEDLKKILK